MINGIYPKQWKQHESDENKRAKHCAFRKAKHLQPSNPNQLKLIVPVQCVTELCRLRADEEIVFR